MLVYLATPVRPCVGNYWFSSLHFLPRDPKACSNQLILAAMGKMYVSYSVLILDLHEGQHKSTWLVLRAEVVSGAETEGLLPLAQLTQECEKAHSHV